MHPPATCPLCTAASPQVTGRTHVDGVTAYTQYGCGSCSVQFWWPLKNPGAEWYRKAEQYGERNSHPEWSATTNHKNTLSYLGTSGRVLDVGCGIGNFLAEAKKRGWQCAGIDFDPDAIEAAKKVAGVSDYEVADVVTYAKNHPDKKFDLITFFDVLEHVDNHNEFIQSIKSLLVSGGHLAMSMPYRKHAIWLMKGDVPPRHLTCWDRKSLRNFLEARGFEVVYMRRSSEGIWPIVMKLRFKYGKWASFGAVSAVRKSVGTLTASVGTQPLPVRLVHIIAQLKDAVLFGIPATIIFVAMLPFPQRYIDLFAIARMRQTE